MPIHNMCHVAIVMDNLKLMDNVNKVTRDFGGTKINMKKTKVMCISRKGNNKLKIYVNGQQVEQLSHYRYLGSLISEDGFETESRWRRKFLWRKRN